MVWVSNKEGVFNNTHLELQANKCSRRTSGLATC